MNMRAKFKVSKVEIFGETSQRVTMSAVTETPFDANGESEDNSFSRWTPSGELTMSITNPRLMGALKEGSSYYLDFTEAS